MEFKNKIMSDIDIQIEEQLDDIMKNVESPIIEVSPISVIKKASSEPQKEVHKEELKKDIKDEDIELIFSIPESEADKILMENDKK